MEDGGGATTVPTVLIADNDLTVRTGLTRSLANSGYLTQESNTAIEVARKAVSGRVDIVVCDPLNSLSVIRHIRMSSNVPVIITSIDNNEEFIAKMLDSGADDYVAKPYCIDQLIARIHALLRRTKYGLKTDDLIVVGDIRIYPTRRSAFLRDTELGLTRMEFDLLCYLARKQCRIVHKRAITNMLWGGHANGSERRLKMHVTKLRRKLGESAANPGYIHTVRGVGLKLVPYRADRTTYLHLD